RASTSTHADRRATRSAAFPRATSNRIALNGAYFHHSRGHARERVVRRAGPVLLREPPHLDASGAMDEESAGVRGAAVRATVVGSGGARTRRGRVRHLLRAVWRRVPHQ